MTSALGALSLNRVIIHVIPRNMKNAAADPIQLSEAECKLPEEIRTKLQVQLQGTLADVRRPIVEDSEAKSEVPVAVKSFLSGDGGNFVKVSRQLASLLHSTQSWNASDGILLVAECNLGESASLALVKIEREDGMRAALTTENGKKTFDMQYFPDLFFAGKSKVYKICVFSYFDEETEALLGWAADTQGTGKKLATYFLSKYLGCRYGDDSKEQTRKFYEVTEEWINKVVVAPSSRARYDIALAAEMNRNASLVSSANFARENLSVGDRDSFVNYLNQKGIPPLPFEKDTSLIASYLDRRRFVFRNGVTITAPMDTLNEAVKVEELDEVNTQMTITGELREVRGSAPSGKPRTTTVGSVDR